MGGRRLIASAAAAIAVGLVAAPAAQATFHLMKVREVHPAGDASYVELQMFAPGQYLVAGHHLVAYKPDGSEAEHGDFALPSNVSAASPNNATILIADSGYAAAFPSGPTPDETDTNLNLSPAGGAVCWTDGSPPDCVAWGDFTGTLPSHVPALVVGNPASPGGVTAGKALRRTIAPGCSTLLEEADDTDDSATDFAEVSPAPRDNATPPTETPCAGAPNTPIDDRPLLHSNSTSAEFTYNAPTATSYECKLDAAVFSACPLGGPKEYTGLADGSHTFQVRGVNASGPDPTPASYTWTVDTVPPTTTIDTHPADPSPGASASFTFHAPSEVGSTFKCALDGAIPATCASGATFHGLANGSHTFAVEATDAAGNQQVAPTEFTWTVDNSLLDTTPPETTIDSKPSDPSGSFTASFTYESNEAGSTFECALDGTAFASCPATGISYTDLVNGSHTFRVRAIDSSSNVDPTPAGYTFDVESVPTPIVPSPRAGRPETTISAKPPAKIHDRTPTFRFGSDEAGSAFQCRVDGKPFKPCHSPFTTKSLSFGRHTVKIRAVDGALADPTPAKFSFKVVRR
jgi:hypothetical protein